MIDPDQRRLWVVFDDVARDLLVGFITEDGFRGFAAARRAAEPRSRANFRRMLGASPAEYLRTQEPFNPHP